MYLLILYNYKLNIDFFFNLTFLSKLHFFFVKRSDKVTGLNFAYNNSTKLNFDLLTLKTDLLLFSNYLLNSK